MDHRLRRRLRDLDPDSVEALLLRLRAGDLSERRLRVAALLGHPAAAEIEEPDFEDVELFGEHDIQRQIRDLLTPQQRAAYVADVAEKALSTFEGYIGGLRPQIKEAIKAARAYARTGDIQFTGEAQAAAERLRSLESQAIPRYDHAARFALATAIEAAETVENDGRPSGVIYTMRSLRNAALQSGDTNLYPQVRLWQLRRLGQYILGTAGPRARSNPDESARRLERSFETIEEEQAYLLGLLRTGEISPMGYATAHALLYPAAAEETPQTYGAIRLNMAGKSLRGWLSNIANNHDLGGLFGESRIYFKLVTGLARAIRRYLPAEFGSIGEEFEGFLNMSSDDPGLDSAGGALCDRVGELLELIPVVNEEWPVEDEAFWGRWAFDRWTGGLARQSSGRWQKELRALHSGHINPVRGAAFEAMRELLYAIGVSIRNEQGGNCLSWLYGQVSDRVPLALDHALMIGPSRRRPQDPFYEDFLYTATKPAVEWILFDPNSPWRPGGRAANTPYRAR